MIHIIKKHEFLRFLVIGGINTLFGFLAFSVFSFIGFEYRLAVLCSTILGIIFNFNTIGRLVFNQSKFNILMAVKFLGVYGISYFLNTIGIGYVMKIIDNIYLSGFIVIIPVSVIIYFLNKFIVFK